MHSSPSSQRGVAAIVVALVLLFGMTMVAFFAGRGMLFEQRSSAINVRSTVAFEAAEAGIEWAIGRLNDRRVMAATSATCVPSGTAGASFRDRYVPSAIPTGGTVAVFNPTAARPGCTRNANGVTWDCSCPASTTAVASLSGSNPAFTVTFDRTGITDPQSVRITSYGCTSPGSQCLTTGAAADGFARVTVIAKVRPILRAGPSSALTTGGWAQVCGAFNIQNGDQGSNGNLVNSGGAIQLGSDYGTIPSNAPSGAPSSGCGGNVQINATNGIGLTTVPGTPYQNALVTNDDSLATASASSDSMFATFFGSTLTNFKAAPTTVVINTGSATGNATAITDAYAQGYTSFWVEGALQFSGTYSLGTVAKPVLIASSGDMTYNGNGTITGIVYSDSADWNANGSGNANIRGAVVSRVNYKNNGNGSIVYDPDVLKNFRDDSGVLVRLPGSWRDF